MNHWTLKRFSCACLQCLKTSAALCPCLCSHACTGMDLEGHEKVTMNEWGKGYCGRVKKGAEEHNKRSGRCVEREVEGES